MGDYKLSVGVEPTDMYEKAKKDMLQTLESVQSLSPFQRQKLAEEMLGVAGFERFCQLLNCYYRQ